ncbi:protein transport protein Sec61 subunit beta-like [Glycine soja]|uniref:Protein transport protein Sec61 subunit beta n=2 Tax=Glycine soja TaxID=3848 RepID=A0A445L7N0_GLYSO|nr:protein transport protein Sec61 subunit beta-like [Glycine soja]RZC19089.1 Protein transport protein Sec61 subunit beta [Glycine soja]
MAKGSQSSTSTATRPILAGMAPRGFAVATTSMHRRRLNNRNSSTSTVIGGGSSNMLRFYTDDAPGLKISSTVVLVMSFCFIGFTALHVFGKLYRSKSGGAV